MSLRERVRAILERLLPWYDPDLEARRDHRSRAIHRYSIAARQAVERAMAPNNFQSYRRARRHQ